MVLRVHSSGDFARNWKADLGVHVLVDPPCGNVQFPTRNSFTATVQQTRDPKERDTTSPTATERSRRLVNNNKRQWVQAGKKHILILTRMTTLNLCICKEEPYCNALEGVPSQIIRELDGVFRTGFDYEFQVCVGVES